MADEHGAQIQLAQKRLNSLYDYLLRPAAKDEQAINQLVKNIEDAVREIPLSSGFYQDGEALRHFGMFAPGFFALLVAIDGNDRARTKSALDKLRREITLVSNGDTAKWLSQPLKELSGTCTDVRAKTETLVDDVLDKLRVKVFYDDELRLIELLQTKTAFDALQDRKNEVTDLVQKYKVSTRFSEVQIEKVAKEQETLQQLERVTALLNASPGNPALEALHAKALKDHSSVLAAITKELDKARESLAIAQRRGDWDDVRAQANQILLYREGDMEAQTAKAEADAHQKSIQEAKGQESVILQMISEGKIAQAYEALKKTLDPIPAGGVDGKINELFALKDTLTSFQIQWQDMVTYTQQNEFGLAAARAKTLLDSGQNPLPASVRELLEKKINEWKLGQKELQDAEKSDQTVLAVLRAELEQAADWNALYVVRQKTLALAQKLRTASAQEEMERLQARVEEALDQALAVEVKQLAANAPHSFEAATRMITELEALIPDAQALSKESEKKAMRRFFTQAGRDLHRVVIEEVQRNLENYQATSNDWVGEAQRLLKGGYLAQALRFAQKAERTGRAPKSKDVIRDIRMQQDALDDIRQLAGGNVDDAREKLEVFLQQHEYHAEAKQLAKQLDFVSVDWQWEAALNERDAQRQKELASAALLLASNASDRDAWRKRRQEVLERQELYIKGQHLRRQGNLKEAVDGLNALKSFDARADEQVEEIDALITEIKNASQAFQDQKYELAIQLFENLKKQISLSEERQTELNRAYFEFHHKAAEDAVQIYDLEEAVRHYEQASRHAPTQTSARQIQKELDKNRSLLREVQDWQKKVTEYLKQGADFEMKGNLDAAKGRYSDAFALKLSASANDYTGKLYPALRADLIEALDRVAQLIPLKAKITEMDSREDVDAQERLNAYSLYLQLSVTSVQEYKDRASALESALKSRNTFRSEFEIIRTKLGSGDVEQLGQAFQRIAELEKLVIETGDFQLNNDYNKLSRDAYQARQEFGQYQKSIEEANRLINEAKYEPALAVLRRAEAQKKTPQVEALLNEVTSSIQRQQAIAEQFKQVEAQVQDGNWKEAGEILSQVKAAVPSDPDQKAQLETLRQKITGEIEKADALRRHLETIHGLLKRFDYAESDKQLGIAREKFGNRLEFIDIEHDIERIRQDCIRLHDLLTRANEAFIRNKLNESQNLYKEVILIPHAEEIIQVKGWQTLRKGNDSIEPAQKTGSLPEQLRKLFGR